MRASIAIPRISLRYIWATKIHRNFMSEYKEVSQDRKGNSKLHRTIVACMRAQRNAGNKHGFARSGNPFFNTKPGKAK
jgi:hypothetical protein